MTLLPRDCRAKKQTSTMGHDAASKTTTVPDNLQAFALVVHSSLDWCYGSRRASSRSLPVALGMLNECGDDLHVYPLAAAL